MGISSVAGQASGPGRPKRRRHPTITMVQAVDAKEGWLFAIRSGWPPNLFVTVNWRHAPALKVDDHPMDRNGRLRDGLKAWLYRHAPGLPFVWIEVREKTRRDGEHVHLVIHVPPKLHRQFVAAVVRLVRAQSGEVEPNAVDVRPVRHNWWQLHAYLMKGGTDEVRRAYEVRSHWSRSQGVIEGPRVKIAHAIGRTARNIA